MSRARSTPAARATAIILARAGSKGVPGKNTARIAGRPCIEWTILAARAARAVSRIVVSSDDNAALRLARRHKCETVQRPPALAGDTATIDAAARHACETLGLAGPIVILYANVPIRPPTLIDDAVRLLARSDADSVQSYAPVGKFHPWWTARVNGQTGQVLPWEGDVLNHGVFRRQDLPPAHIPDGGVIAVTLDALMLRLPGVPDGPHAFFGRDRRGIVNPEGSVVDIDAPTDLLVAHAMLKRSRPRVRPSARRARR